MPKQAFTFTDLEVSKILGEHIITTGLIPMGKYDVWSKVSGKPDKTGYTVTLELEKVVDNGTK